MIAANLARALSLKYMVSRLVWARMSSPSSSAAVCAIRETAAAGSLVTVPEVGLYSAKVILLASCSIMVQLSANRQVAMPLVVVCKVMFLLNATVALSKD